MSNAMVDSAKKTMFPADLKRGQLHRDLGVPQGKKIPIGKLRAATKKKGKVGLRARWAANVRNSK